MKTPPEETVAEMSARHAKAIRDAGAATEAEMREQESPHPRSIEELAAYVEALATRPHDYGTCVYAMSLAAVAAFNYIAHRLGVTGFQASCADLDILRRTRSIRHGFMVVKAEDLLYPQCDPLPKVLEFIEEQRRELAPVARELLKKETNVAPAVRAHWKELARA
jgi:hypothetical protein